MLIKKLTTLRWYNALQITKGTRATKRMRTGPIPLFYSQLQTWSKTWSQAGRKHVESQLRTCLKRVFCTLHLSSTRTNQRACCGSRPGFRQKKSKAGRKRVANPHELVENLAANLVENQSVYVGNTQLQGVKKISPLKRLGIFSLLLSLFAWNFANLLAIHIHIYLPTFVDLS